MPGLTGTAKIVATWHTIAQELFFKEPGDRLSANNALDSIASGRLSELQTIPSNFPRQRDKRLIPHVIGLVKTKPPRFGVRGFDGLTAEYAL